MTLWPSAAVWGLSYCIHWTVRTGLCLLSSLLQCVPPPRVWALTAGHTAGGQTAIGQNPSPIFLCTEENVCWMLASVQILEALTIHIASRWTLCKSSRQWMGEPWGPHREQQEPRLQHFPWLHSRLYWGDFCHCLFWFPVKLMGNKALLILQIPRRVEPAVYCYDSCSYISHFCISFSWDSVDRCLSL